MKNPYLPLMLREFSKHMQTNRKNIPASFITSSVLQRILCVVLFLALSFSFTTTGKSEAFVSTETLLANMFRAIQNTQRLSYTIKNTERIDGKLLTGIQNVHWQRSPLMCHLKFEAPNEGSEVIFIEGQNENQARYRPNGFPYMDLDLDPMGSVMRRNNHHTIYELGFDYFGNLIQHYYTKHPELFINKGIRYWQGQKCYLIELNSPIFTYSSYTPTKGDSSYNLSRRLFVSEYLLLEKNTHISSQDELPAKSILVPNSYANRIELYIACENYLPIHQSIYDEKGLFEQYSFYNLSINPEIPQNLFKL